uniref:uncharacterized protein LOC129513467 n=1 Tax=Nyctereutes procyonoides TaxID=34880 RepID=UPI0024443FB3|nr:uncharacterized protein LOC129513467 [Nyctereutes procyonoides]
MACGRQDPRLRDRNRACPEGTPRRVPLLAAADTVPPGGGPVTGRLGTASWRREAHASPRAPGPALITGRCWPEGRGYLRAELGLGSDDRPPGSLSARRTATGTDTTPSSNKDSHGRPRNTDGLDRPCPHAVLSAWSDGTCSLWAPWTQVSLHPCTLAARGQASPVLHRDFPISSRRALSHKPGGPRGARLGKRLALAWVMISGPWDGAFIGLPAQMGHQLLPLPLLPARARSLSQINKS